MIKSQKTTLLILIGIGLLYFFLFIPPNLVGARDANMLSVFEVDEFAYYPHILRMLTPGDTLYQSLRNFALYLLYVYGYPFFFFSALTLLPVKLLTGAAWEGMTPLNVLLLRQMLSVLPVVLGSLLLVVSQTHLRSRWRSVGLFIFLLIVPGAVGNNIFWHPDGLSFLFVALTFFFLERDNLRFGRCFWLAAFACGLAVSVKNQGLFFFLAIPLYIIWGYYNPADEHIPAGQNEGKWPTFSPLAGQKKPLSKYFWRAFLFLLVMFAALIISNPLLLLPMERAEILGAQTRNLSQLASGFMVKTTDTYFSWGTYPEDFRLHYGELAFVLLALAAALFGVIRPQRRLFNALILAWFVPLMFTLNTAGTRRTAYFIPAMLPLYSALVNLFEDNNGQGLSAIKSGGWRPIVTAVFGLLVVAQSILFLQADAVIYTNQLQREQNAKALAFYQNVQGACLNNIVLQRKTVIYRDWHIYVPPEPRFRIEMNWDLASYAYLAELKPDVILLEMENVALFTRPGVVEQATNPDIMQAWQDFYGDAAGERLPGYRLCYRDKFGLALVKEDLQPAQP